MRITGTITVAGERFSFIRSDDGQDFFVPGSLGLAIGAEVSFHADPSETLTTGRRLATAHDVAAVD